MVTVYLTFKCSNLANTLASLKLSCTYELRGDDVSREELKMELDFEKVREEKIRFLDSHHVIVLATSFDDRVTARTVTYASKGLEVYFMSWVITRSVFK